MDEEAITNLLNVVADFERRRVERFQRAEIYDRGDAARSYLLGVSDGYQFAGSILRNMLLSMGVTIPEGV